ncbi:MAG: hypothetical protein IJG16_12220, partial [Clostridia bacterium]|nr:hypothetical protein [Clostridia bacterium]
MISSFIESYYQTSGVPLVGVKAARGGTDTNYWTASERKTEAVARYNEAKKFLEDSGYTIGKQFMVWCQGESDGDKGRSDSAHTSKLSEIFGYMKDGTTLTDMFIVRIGHCRSGSEIDPVSDPIYKRLNLAQKAFADETANVTAVASLYTDEYLALMRDNYHYYQPAYNSVGTVAGNNTAVTLYNKGIWTNYPEPTEDVVEELDGIFEKTSSDAEITVSDMTSYGADTFRVYKADKSYVDIKTSDGKIANPTGNAEVTVVPVYRFNYASAAKDGYTSARSAYTKETGYGTYGSVTLDENGALPSSGSLRVSLPNGRYDINVQRAGGTRFNVYNDGYRITTNEGINTMPQNRGNESALMYAPQVLNEDQTIDITVSGTNGSPRISELEIVRVPDKYKKSVVWIAGDSESANYYPQNADGDDLASNKIMRTGFGMMLPKFLNGGKYKLANLGEPSATIKTWSDGNLDSVLHNIDSGDTIIVDFGINEKVSGSNGLSQADMQIYMQQLFTAVKAKGAKPILVSPVSCGKYQDRAYFRFTGGTNDMYSFAETAQVDCIDLNKYLQQYITAAADDTATSESDWKKFNYHEGDNLHITQHGALLAASFIAAGMKALGYETTDYAYTYTDISSIGDNYTRGTETENKRVYS